MGTLFSIFFYRFLFRHNEKLRAKHFRFLGRKHINFRLMVVVVKLKGSD